MTKHVRPKPRGLHVAEDANHWRYLITIEHHRVTDTDTMQFSALQFAAGYAVEMVMERGYTEVLIADRRRVQDYVVSRTSRGCQMTEHPAPIKHRGLKR